MSETTVVTPILRRSYWLAVHRETIVAVFDTEREALIFCDSLVAFGRRADAMMTVCSHIPQVGHSVLSYIIH